MNDVDIFLEQGAILVKDNIYEFSEGFTDLLNQMYYMMISSKMKTKLKRFLKDIRYDVGKGDKKREKC